MGWFFTCYCAETSHLDFGRLSVLQIELIVIVRFFFLNVGEASLHERLGKPFPQASHRPANHKGVLLQGGAGRGGANRLFSMSERSGCIVRPIQLKQFFPFNIYNRVTFFNEALGWAKQLRMQTQRSQLDVDSYFPRNCGLCPLSLTLVCVSVM